MRLLFLFLLPVFALSTFGQINIWERTDCHKRVELTPYIVETKQADSLPTDTGVCHYNGTEKGSKGVIVCPGGSYFWHDMLTEGHAVARWLQSNGIAAFVLRYRTAYVPAFMFRHCPPVFLVNCKDDPIVDYRNSVLLDSALTTQGIAHKYIQYSTGGHGFGASDTKGTAECRQWRAVFLDWLARTSPKTIAP